MFCSECGKKVAKNSKFCNHCGKPLTATQSSRGFSDSPPKFISKVGWARSGPTDKSLFGKVHYGYQFFFVLEDSSHKPTRCDGIVKVKMLRRQATLPFGTLTHKKAHQLEISVKSSDFCQSTTDTNFWGYWKNVEEAILMENEYYDVEVWFTTPDGNTLYGTDRT
jgi:hypothetical protein